MASEMNDLQRRQGASLSVMIVTYNSRHPLYLPIVSYAASSYQDASSPSARCPHSGTEPLGSPPYNMLCLANFFPVSRCARY